MPEPPLARDAGFRFYWTDAAFILGLCVMAWVGRERHRSLLWVLPFAAGHFFLFCNVFRVRRSYELVWAVCAVVNFFAWRYAGSGPVPAWGVIALQAPVTIAVIVREMRSPRYHGIFAERLNPRLPDYLAGANLKG